MIDRAARVALSWPGIIVLAGILSVVIFGPLMPPVDGWIAPVTTKVVWVNVQPLQGGGMVVQMEFNKLRDCELLGVSADQDGVPIPFVPAPAAVSGAGSSVGTVGTGFHISRPWLLGATTLAGIHLRFIHRCNPLWLTITQAYP